MKTAAVRVFFWASNLQALPPLKRQDKTRHYPATSITYLGILLFWAPFFLQN